MNIEIICIGTLKERYWREAVDEYSKRLGRYCSLAVYEIREERLPKNPSAADEDAVKIAEGKSMLKKVKDGSYVIALDVNGKAFSSEAFSEKLAGLPLAGRSQLSFLIGGSLGLSEEILGRADERVSFSKMTFPHQMMRVILLEQIYRGFKIIRNEEYHK